MSAPRSNSLTLGIASAICLLVGRIGLILSVYHGLAYALLNIDPGAGPARIAIVGGSSLVLLAIPMWIAKDARAYLNLLVVGLCFGSALFGLRVAEAAVLRASHSLSSREVRAGLISFMGFALSYYYIRQQKGRRRASSPTVRPRKSPLHLLFLPIIFGGAGAYVWLATGLAVHAAGWFHPAITSFRDLPAGIQGTMMVCFILGSFPLGLLLANLTIFVIPPARRFFAREAAGRAGEDFHTASHGLYKSVEYLTVPLTIIGFAAPGFLG